MENVVVVRDGDEELSLFLEMRRREKLQGVSSLSQPGEFYPIFVSLNFDFDFSESELLEPKSKNMTK